MEEEVEEEEEEVINREYSQHTMQQHSHTHQLLCLSNNGSNGSIGVIILWR